mgnify:CR=1 FL=1|jgi:alpha-amylase
MTSAIIELRAQHKDPSVVLSYVFGGTKQSSPRKLFTSTSLSSTLSVAVLGSDGTRLDLEPVDFHWNVVTLMNRSGDFRDGQKGAIVEMFGWPDADVQAECAFLGSSGYLGVKLYPHQEQLMSAEPFNNMLNPWCVGSIRTGRP